MKIVHQGKYDRIIVEDDKNQTPQQIVGANIRELRANRGLALRLQASLLSIEPSHLSDAENGRLSLEETTAIYDQIYNEVPDARSDG